MKESGKKLERVTTLPFELNVGERVRARAAIRAIDHAIAELATRSAWDRRFPDDKELEQRLAELESRRKQLFDELSTMAPPLSAPNRTPSARTGAPTATGALSRLFTDIACTPTAEETVWLPALGPFMQSSDENTTAGAETTVNGEAVVFALSVEDPNNDPFNWDSAGQGFLRIFWEYELPLRAYDATFDLSAMGRFNAQVRADSNHIFGTRWWQGYFAGGLIAQGTTVTADDINQQFFFFRESGPDDLDYRSGGLQLTLQVQSEANQPTSVFLYYSVLLICDRSRTDCVGSARVSETTSPALMCTIRPV